MTHANASAEYQYAGFWRRTGAYFADAILAQMIFWPWVYFLENHLRLYFGEHQVLFLIVQFLASEAIVMLLIIAFWVKRGATPGMMLLELRVIDSQHFKSLTWKQATARLLMRMLAILTVIGVLLLIWNDRKQALHDMVCNTIVVDAREDYQYLQLPNPDAAI